MVAVHRAYGYRFVIYTLDHEPAHVHVTGPGQAKINLLGPGGAPELVWRGQDTKAHIMPLSRERMGNSCGQN